MHSDELFTAEIPWYNNLEMTVKEAGVENGATYSIGCKLKDMLG